MIQLRPITVPLFCLYRDGVLVAGFTSIMDAAAYEDRLEAEAEVAEVIATEPTPLYAQAADALTVALLRWEDVKHASTQPMSADALGLRPVPTEDDGR